MSFIDGVTNFTKGVGTKARGNYDVVNLNSRINSLTKEVSSLYTSIGEMYYSLHRDDHEESFGVMVNEVNKRVDEINRLKREIEFTKETMASVQLINSQPQPQHTRFCVNCGCPVEAGNQFCVKCGTKQPDIYANAQTGMIHNGPHSPAAGNALYSGPAPGNVQYAAPAPAAGNTVYAAPAADKTQYTAPEPPLPDFDEDEPATCPDCGNPVDADATFCTSCGRRL